MSKKTLTFSLTEQEVELTKDVNEISTNTFIEQQQTKGRLIDGWRTIEGGKPKTPKDVNKNINKYIY